MRLLVGLAVTRNLRRLRAVRIPSRPLSVTRDYGSPKRQWSYSMGTSRRPLVGATIGQLLQGTTELYPDREVVVFSSSNTRLTLQQLLQQSDELAAGLLSLGLRRGDRLGMWAPNCPEWLIVQYATARAGIIMVNINPAYQAAELRHALRKAGVRTLVTCDQFRTQDFRGLLGRVCPELGSATPGHLQSPSCPDLEHVIMISEEQLPGCLRFSDIIQAATPALLAEVSNIQPRLQSDDPINIQFTSGTTGTPKGVTLTHHGIVNQAGLFGRNYNYHDVQQAVIGVPVPLYHCFGMTGASMMIPSFGAKCVFPSPSFDPQTILTAIHNERVTSLYGTPTMFIDILSQSNLSEFDITSLNTGLMGGAPCPQETMKQIMTKLHMPQVTLGYGATETTLVTFLTAMDDPVELRSSTVGRVLPHTEAKIIDEAGEVLPVGHQGELCVRGFTVMRGYWDDADKTAEVIGPDHWYRTGDVARMDEAGYVQIVGRIKDLIIRGGENIYPAEVEHLMYTHAAIEEVQVFGVPDERLGEQVCAWIKLKQGHSATATDIKQFCKGQMSHFKVPHYIWFVEEFPMTVTGKIQKFKMREKTLEHLGIK